MRPVAAQEDEPLVLRRILVEHARSRRARREREASHSGRIDVPDAASAAPSDHVLAVDDALERLGAVKDKEAPSVDGNDVVYRHPSPERLKDGQLRDGIEFEIRSYYDPLFKPKGYAID